MLLFFFESHEMAQEIIIAVVVNISYPIRCHVECSYKKQHSKHFFLDKQHCCKLKTTDFFENAVSGCKGRLQFCYRLFITMKDIFDGLDGLNN